MGASRVNSVTILASIMARTMLVCDVWFSGVLIATCDSIGFDQLCQQYGHDIITSGPSLIYQATTLGETPLRLVFPPAGCSLGAYLLQEPVQPSSMVLSATLAARFSMARVTVPC